MPAFTYVEDLAKEVQIPQNGMLSQTLHSDDKVKVSVFAFSAGQELKRHSAAVPVMVQIVRGEARLDLDGEVKEAGPGAFVYMEANLPHSVYAKSDMVMLLAVLTGTAAK